MRRWLREPLVHFMVLGALIFMAYAMLAQGAGDPDEIVVTRGQQEHLVTAFTRTWQRPPTPAEFEGLIREWLREEIAYREGTAMGLDTDDTIIRRRLRQKLELVTEDLAGLVEPTDAELSAYLEENSGAFEREARYTLRQIYFSPDRRGDDAVGDAEQARVLLAAQDDLVDASQLGDPLPLPGRFELAWESALARQFGSAFADALEGLEPGVWSGPITSGYGIHLVRVESMEPARPLTLEEARRDLTRDFEHQRRQRAIDQLYEALAERYTIRIEPPDANPLPGSSQEPAGRSSP